MSDHLHDRIQALKHQRKNYRSPNAAAFEPDTRRIGAMIATAPRCEHCGRPMLAGQKTRHLVCMPNRLGDRP